MDASNALPAKNPPKTLLVIDAANFLYRAYHAMDHAGKTAFAPDGTPTIAFSTFAAMVKSAKKASGAHAILIALESPGPTFRDTLFPDYKANRKPTPEAISIQMKLVEEIFPLMGIPTVFVEGVEADDILCSYGFEANEEWRVVMASKDKDIGQAVSEHASQLDPNQWVLMNEASIVEKFGVPPSQIPSFLALQGDSIDNIPGVTQCGAKTAAKQLLKHGDIPTIYQHVDELTPKLKEGFLEAKPRMTDLLKLTTASIVPLPMTPDEIYMANHQPRWDLALERFKTLNIPYLAQKAEKGLAAVQQREQRLAATSKPVRAKL